MRKIRSFSYVAYLFLIILGMVFPMGRVVAAPQAQVPTPEERALALLETLTPKEKVGQLFLVTFNGTDTGLESQINDLVSNYHIGGVILRAENDNFIGPEDTLTQVISVTRSLQTIEWLASQNTGGPEAESGGAFIPVFIGIAQEGDGYAEDQIINGLTRLPNQMALGATWQPDLAQEVGRVMGEELSRLGFNLFLGPSLDVLESPSPESAGDLGTRTFGGDPFWVGKMGSAYVEGLHLGSQNQMLVVGKHFPGHGGSDRPPEDEIATVRKSLEQLKQIELAPFFSVTGQADSPESALDGLLVSHIKYQGFQGNIRASTRPVSFDSQALSQLLSLPEFESWRSSGGILISDDLGSRAVRRFFDPTDLSFNARLVVRDAFLAGNDMLFLGNITDTGDPDSFTSATRILDFFVTKYQEDVAFAQRVDESVFRILTQKYRLYDIFSLENVLNTEEHLDGIGQNDQVSFSVARNSATLISPSLTDLDTNLPTAPWFNDRIVFISDSYMVGQCSSCPVQPVLDADAFEEAVTRLYGPEAGNQVLRPNLSSHSFEELLDMLDSTEGVQPLESIIRSADWVVVSMLDIDEERPASIALNRFLAERPDLISQNRVVVFAFNAPYYLDATDISKLSAYFGLYSKSPEFIDAAARILFKELTDLPGASPVSVQGIGYDLITITSPDPSQVIPVLIDAPEQPAPEGDSTPEPTPTIEVQLGETLNISTGIIIDYNGNPVPDGTPVQFVFNIAGEETFSPPFTTVNGVVRTTFQLTSPGRTIIRAISDQAVESTLLEFNIPEPEVPFTPTPTASFTPQPTLTATIVPPSPMPTPEVIETPTPRTQTDLLDWTGSAFLTVLIGFLIYRLGIFTGQTRWSIRWALSGLLGGLITYLYISINLPGSAELILSSGRPGVIGIVLLGIFAGMGVSILWFVIERGTALPRENYTTGELQNNRTGPRDGST